MEHSDEVDWLDPASGTIRHSLSCRGVGLAGSDWRALLSRGKASQSCRSCGRIPVETKRREVDEALTLARSLLVLMRYFNNVVPLCIFLQESSNFPRGILAPYIAFQHAI
jgi:hypothetical protein